MAQDPLDTLKYNLLAEGAEDFLGLWEILWEVHHTLGVVGVAEARAKTIELIRGYLEEGLVIPGLPIGNGPDFAPMDLTPEEAIAAIESAWRELQREPVAGDICWFTTSDRGKQWVLRYCEEHSEDREGLSRQ
jgi:hypothetical protein